MNEENLKYKLSRACSKIDIHNYKEKGKITGTNSYTTNLLAFKKKKTKHYPEVFFRAMKLLVSFSENETR